MEKRKCTDIWKEFQEKLKQDALTESDFTVMLWLLSYLATALR